ncbi:MAG: DUF5615 family PIN-like protein [Vicinamibacterales bacterium]
MGTLASELAGRADSGSDQPRVYVDANVSATLVTYMRQRLGWDVLYVMEQDDLRRASDVEHFRMARQLRRTLITFDHDFLDDRLFPPAESGGVLVLSAPDDSRYRQMLLEVDARVFRPGAEDAGDRRTVPVPLEGRTQHLTAEWAPQRSRGLRPDPLER